MNQIKAGAVLSYLSLGLGNIISLLYTPFMIRLMGQSEYGLYGLATSVTAYLGLLSFGFNGAYMRYHALFKAEKNEGEMAKLNGMFLAVFTIAGLLALLGGGILALFADSIFQWGLTGEEIVKVKILMVILMCNVAIGLPLNIFASHIAAQEKYVFLKLINLLRTVLNPLLMLPLLFLGYRSITMALVSTLLNLLVGGVNIIYCVKKLNIHFCFRKIPLPLWKDVSVFSSFVFMNMLTDQINWNVDKFLLGMFKGTAQVAVYGVGAQFHTYYLSFSSASVSVLVPKINRMVAQKEDNHVLSELFARVGRIQCIILSFILGGFIIFGREFITMLWAGKDYEQSYWVGLLLLLPVTVPLLQGVGLEIQRAKNRHRFRAVVYFMIAVVNLGISIPLCRRFGAVGAAAGTAVTQFIGAGVLMNWYYEKHLGLHVRYFWKQISRLLPALLLPAVYGIIYMCFKAKTIPGLLAAMAGYSALFIFSMWRFGMNPYEKGLLLAKFGKNEKKSES